MPNTPDELAKRLERAERTIAELISKIEQLEIKRQGMERAIGWLEDDVRRRR